MRDYEIVTFSDKGSSVSISTCQTQDAASAFTTKKKKKQTRWTHRQGLERTQRDGKNEG